MLTACSSVSTVKFNSNPSEAEVSILDNQGISTIIGKTPLTANESDVYKNSSRYAQVIPFLKINSGPIESSNVTFLHGKSCFQYL